MQVAVLRADARVVESGGDGVCVDDVAVGGLKEHRLGAVQHAEASAVYARGVFARCKPLASGLDADELDGRIVDEAGEESDGVRAAAYARDGLVRQAAKLLEALAASLLADYALEVAHHLGVRGGTRHRADHIERVVAVRHPVAKSLVHRVLERRAALGDGVDLSAEHLHALDVRGLALDVEGAHVDLAVEAEERCDRGRGDAVHSGAGLGYQAALAHAAGEEGLSDGVVHLVGACVVQVLALEVDARAAEVVGEALGTGERTLPADVVAKYVRKLLCERGICLGGLVGELELLQGSHERFRNVLSAVYSVMCLHKIILVS